MALNLDNVFIDAFCMELFQSTLYHDINEAFECRGIDAIYEDELQDIVDECVAKVYKPSVMEFKLRLRNGTIFDAIQ